jgi:hypothetical protein
VVSVGFGKRVKLDLLVPSIIFPFILENLCVQGLD